MKTSDAPPLGGHVHDLSIGESAAFTFGDGRIRRLTLLALHEPRCSVRSVIRAPRITVDVDGERADCPAAEYHMPQTVNGVRVACSVTRGVAESLGKYKTVYALDKDARIRCWPPRGPLFGPTPLVYPAR